MNEKRQARGIALLPIAVFLVLYLRPSLQYLHQKLTATNLLPRLLILQSSRSRHMLMNLKRQALRKVHPKQSRVSGK